MSNRDREVGIGLIGFGTIGRGVVRVLGQNAAVISERLGARLRLVRIADLDTETDRGVDLEGIHFDSDAKALIADPAVDIVVELIGGTGAARALVADAIAAGKHVVTANKALLAHHGSEIFAQAAAAGVDVAFEASVGGGIPVLRALREGLAADRVLSIEGILNGTTNYILSEMEATGEAFEVILKRAQDLGYAEADPTFDIDGIDAAQKLGILVAMAFGAELDVDSIPTQGLRDLAPIDFEVARELGFRVKMLGIAREAAGEGDERIEARVHPALISLGSQLASVDGAMNAVLIVGDAVGPTLYYGAGAGEMPTASAVVADAIEIGREILRGAGAGRVPPLSRPLEALHSRELVPTDELHGRAYLRFEVTDEPGVLSKVTGALGANDIGIESVLQRGPASAGGSISVVVLTHAAPEAALRKAVAEIDEWPEVRARTLFVRIQENRE